MQGKEENEKKESRCRKCGSCLDKDIKALNKKYFGIAVKEYYCLKCLAEIFGVTAEELNQKMKYYQSIGCSLFQ